jgi:hypothetical protein
MSKHGGDKIFADAVRRAVKRRMKDEEGKPQKLERLADTLVDKAITGDVPAIKEVADRLDGKAIQQTENKTTIEAGDRLAALMARVNQRAAISEGAIIDATDYTDHPPEENNEEG